MIGFVKEASFLKLFYRKDTTSDVSYASGSIKQENMPRKYNYKSAEK
jgi:hypothetical protein